MKTIPFLFTFACFLAFSHIISGQETFIRETENFNELHVTGNIRAELYKSDKTYLEVSIKNTESENLITEVKQGKLNIRLKTINNKDVSVRVKVYYSNLEKITVALGALVTSSEIITGKSLIFNARSGGKMDLELELDELKAEATQGATLAFKGEVRRQEAVVLTGAVYSAYLLEAEETNVRVNTGAIAKVRAEKKIEGNVSTAGFIGYIGNPDIEHIKILTGGKITQYKTNEEAGIFEELF